MAEKPSESKNQTAEPLAPEMLKPRATDGSEEPKPNPAKANIASGVYRRFARGRYRVSHRATFIGLSVVIAVLAINAAIIIFIIRRQENSASRANQGEVTVSREALEQLGVNRDTVGELGVELVVNPAARFNKTVKVGGDVSIDGQLTLNNSIAANKAGLGQLEAGKTSLTELNVNGSASLTNVSLRNDLNVTGTTRLQGPVTLSQLLTANGSVNVTGNLTVGGALSIATINTNSLIVNNTLTVGGHVISRGSAPSVSAGAAAGSNATASISGNDTAGTVVVNIGAGAGSGTIVSVSFRNLYGTTPKVVLTAVGSNAGNVYVNRTSSGFSIGVSSALPPGGYAFDYIVVE